ncbi:MAG: hypothetical protein AAF362_20395 [Pseudomonadota bacterium]
MPQLIGIALIALVGWYAWRVLKREMARVDNEVREQEVKAETKEVTPLEKDEDGVYRPKK